MNLVSPPTRIAHWLLALAVMFSIAIASHRAWAQTPAPPQDKIDQLINLLDDPDVRAFLASRSSASAASGEPSAGAATPPAAPSKVNEAEQSLDLWAEGIRSHVRQVASAIPDLPSEIGRSLYNLYVAIESRGIGMSLFAFVLPIVLGGGAEWLYRQVMARRRLAHPDHESALPTISTRLATGIVPPLLFGVVLITLFLAVSSRGIVATLIFRVLLAITIYRLIGAVTRLILRQEKEEVAEPLPDAIAAANARETFWSRRVAVFAGVFLIGWVAAVSLAALGAPYGTTRVVAYAFGIALWAIAVETIWQRPLTNPETRRGGMHDWLLTLWITALWLIWVAGANIMFWLLLYAVLLPIVLRKSTRFVTDAFSAQRKDKENFNILVEVMVDRGVRALIIALAVGWLALQLELHPNIATSDVLVSRVIRGVLGGVLILLFADLVWQLVKAFINRRLELAQIAGGTDEELARKGRLLTLLPTLRNFLAVVIAVVAVLMVLAGLGVQIGPLIAGAGIFGVAIGFGSQALVKDVISGIFYMTDDAFRVGEYIQSGSYKGTVESFSIRSVKLRHHRGPVFTIPFGSLGAVQNMSRDWVIDKFMLQVSYDADIAKVKKLVKGVGAALLEDPEMGPQIIETVKMKGVEQFGDYGITLSFAVMTKPGFQAKIRRTAYLMIREAFAANGIEFASPVVQVAADEHSTAAAAKAANDAIAKKKLATQMQAEGGGEEEEQ
ncbi:mechanosensitive ion channel family protein [Rhizobiaceae bacterium n13]|uniref:Mechanosensitive ion channel family protein n=1 Tax=Ferirhizobium litorale TaxID=2927786 RepID=A0AAE3QBK7_9HYPH|nr:mechanosensitive ion channel family protein [Fererhizobium litorale]MDI7861658.1 mechanosensitive ion channel family protein [Fererhizobium litorale]MDI7922000.1 mechanosensitive ion channel family protein [Fererhizobium litorale]